MTALPPLENLSCDECALPPGECPVFDHTHPGSCAFIPLPPPGTIAGCEDLDDEPAHCPQCGRPLAPEAASVDAAHRWKDCAFCVRAEIDAQTWAAKQEGQERWLLANS